MYCLIYIIFMSSMFLSISSLYFKRASYNQVCNNIWTKKCNNAYSLFPSLPISMFVNDNKAASMRLGKFIIIGLVDNDATSTSKKINILYKLIELAIQRNNFKLDEISIDEIIINVMKSTTLNKVETQNINRKAILLWNKIRRLPLNPENENPIYLMDMTDYKTSELFIYYEIMPFVLLEALFGEDVANEILEKEKLINIHQKHPQEIVKEISLIGKNYLRKIKQTERKMSDAYGLTFLF